MLVSTEREEKGVFSLFNNDIKTRTEITVSNPMRSGYAKELIDLSIAAPVGGSSRAKFALPNNRRFTGTQGRQPNDTIRVKGKSVNHYVI
jgi:hypothetical protein